MKILVLRLGGSDEVLLTTPLIRCLRRTAPSADLHVLTGEAFAPLLQHNPFANKLHTTADPQTLLHSLKEEGFDWLIDLQNDAFSNQLAKELGCKAVRLPQKQTSWLSRLGFQKSAKEAADFVQDCFAAVAPLGIQDDGGGLDYVIPESERVPVYDIPHSHHAGFLCVAIEAVDAKSQLPLPVLQTLCRQINHPVVLIGRRAEVLQGEAIAAVDPIKIYNACGKFSFAETADLIGQSKLLVACPSPWVQVGAALKKEMVILQNDKPLLNTTPYYGKAFLQQKPGVFDAVQIKKRRWYSADRVFDANQVLDKIQQRLRKRL